MAYVENIEKLFKEEIRDKKKTGSGAFHMRGKGVRHGFSGALRTPYHFMTKKEKEALSGEVEVSNMYETIIPLSEFEVKDIETQKLMLSRWRELYDNHKIKTGLGCTNVRYYNLVAELDLPKKHRGGPRKGSGKGKKKKEEKAVAISAVPKIEDCKEEKKPEVQQDYINQNIITNGLHLEYNGKYDSEELNKILTKLQLLVDGETNKFHISISLSEIKK